MDEAGSLRKPRGPDFLAVDSRDRKPSVVRAVDVHSGVDPQHVLVPDRFGRQGVPSHDVTDSFDWPKVFFTEVFHRIPEHPSNRIDQLLPWSCKLENAVSDAA